MNSLAAQTPGEQKNPQETAGKAPWPGPSRTYEFVPRQPSLNVWVRVRCGDGQARSFVAAQVFEPDSGNPLIRIEHGLGLNAVEEICRLVRERKHLDQRPKAGSEVGLGL